MLLDKDLLVEWRVEEMREMEVDEDRWRVEEVENGREIAREEARWMEEKGEKASNKRSVEDEDIAVFTVRATIGHQVGLLPADSTLQTSLTLINNLQMTFQFIILEQ